MNSTANITTWTIDADADNDATQSPVGMTARAYGDVLSAIYNSRALGCIGASAIVDPDEDGRVRRYKATRDEDAQYAVELVEVDGHPVAPAKPQRPVLSGHYAPTEWDAAPGYLEGLLVAAESINHALSGSFGTPRYETASRLVNVARKVITAQASLPQFADAATAAAAQGDTELAESLELARRISLHSAGCYARSVVIMLGGDDAKLAPCDMEAVATYLAALAERSGC